MDSVLKKRIQKNLLDVRDLTHIPLKKVIAPFQLNQCGDFIVVFSGDLFKCIQMAVTDVFNS